MSKVNLLLILLLISCGENHKFHQSISDVSNITFPKNDIINKSHHDIINYNLIKLRSSTGTGHCSGTLIGIDPITVISANHCGKFKVIGGVNPIKSYRQSNENTFLGDNFKSHLHFLNNDLVVHVYPQRAIPRIYHDRGRNPFLLATLDPGHDLEIPEKSIICGYGYSSHIYSQGALGQLNCGHTKFEKTTKKKRLNDSNFFNEYNNENTYDSQMLLHSAALISNLQFKDGIIDSNFSLSNSGDSGGPAFYSTKRDGNKKFILFGVSSFLFPSQDESIITSVYINLRNPKSIAFLKESVEKIGADINGLDELAMRVEVLNR